MTTGGITPKQPLPPTNLDFQRAGEAGNPGSAAQGQQEINYPENMNHIIPAGAKVERVDTSSTANSDEGQNQEGKRQSFWETVLDKLGF